MYLTEDEVLLFDRSFWFTKYQPTTIKDNTILGGVDILAQECWQYVTAATVYARSAIIIASIRLSTILIMMELNRDVLIND
jgi:hypothetical protein